MWMWHFVFDIISILDFVLSLQCLLLTGAERCQNNNISKDFCANASNKQPFHFNTSMLKTKDIKL